MLEKDEVIKSIRDAFAHVSRPEGVDIFRLGWATYDNLDYGLVNFDVHEWDEISFSTVVRHREALTGFTDEWFLFVLPAYLIRTLENLDEADILHETTQYSLTHPVLLGYFDLASENQFRAFVSKLNSTQCYALGMYLRYKIILDPDEAVYDDDNIRFAIQFWDERRREKEAMEGS